MLDAMLEKGAGKVKRQNLERLREAMQSLRVLPYSKQDATLGGMIDAGLEKLGKRIGTKDAMIAGHCAMRGLTLVTDNTREFERVAGLVVENWRKP
jgi:tRNA(fMet)-specific endonuclease VapC